MTEKLNIQWGGGYKWWNKIVLMEILFSSPFIHICMYYMHMWFLNESQIHTCTADGLRKCMYNTYLGYYDTCKTFSELPFNSLSIGFNNWKLTLISFRDPTIFLTPAYKPEMFFFTLTSYSSQRILLQTMYRSRSRKAWWLYSIWDTY